MVGRHTEAVAPESAERLVAVCPGHRGELADVFSGFQGSPASAASGSVVSPSQFRYVAKGKVVVTAVNRSRTASARMTAFVYCL